MGRVYTLQKKCDAVVKKHSNGSHVTKQEHRRVMHMIIYDLNQIRCLPSCLDKIKPDHIVQLVTYWKDKGLMLATIGNRLGVLRRYNTIARLNLDIPSNKFLDTVKSTPDKTNTYISDDFNSHIFHPLTQSVISLQVEFGLTKLEAIRISPDSVSDTSSLTVTRNIAHNRQDRVIPIYKDSQRKTIAEKIQLSQLSPLLQTEGKNTDKIINNLYKAECLYAGISYKTEFRSVYAKRRFNELRSILNTDPILTLCKEMGFSSPRRLDDLLS